MNVRALLTAPLFAVLSLTASASFVVTGNPANDSFPQKGQSLAVGQYVRSGSGAIFSHNFYAHEFELNAVNPLTTMANPWSPGDRVVMLGGVMTPSVTAASQGWATAAANTSVNPANQRINAKFGVATPGGSPLGNTYSASSNAPPAGNGQGSHSGGNGGYGSVQISIGVGNIVTANAGLMLTPLNSTGSNVAQFFGVTSGPGFGTNGLNLIAADLNTFDSVRYMFTVDGSGNLVSWEVFLNTTRVQNYVSPLGPSAYAIAPTGGRNWLQTVSNGGSTFSDSLTLTDVYSVPAPATYALFALGTVGLAGVRRLRKA